MIGLFVGLCVWGLCGDWMFPQCSNYKSNSAVVLWRETVSRAETSGWLVSRKVTFGFLIIGFQITNDSLTEATFIFIRAVELFLRQNTSEENKFKIVIQRGTSMLWNCCTGDQQLVNQQEFHLLVFWWSPDVSLSCNSQLNVFGLEGKQANYQHRSYKLWCFIM